MKGRLTLGGIALLGALTVAIGFQPISPRDAARWALGLAHGIDAPDLSDPARIRSGAVHYDLFCADCHASPSHPQRGNHLIFSPPAPRLHLRIEGWLPEYLFPIVRDGVRGTAMPAWPVSHREDEVWAMVAFLTNLPGMAPDEYRRLTGQGQTSTALSPGLANCTRCHGSDGRGGADRAFPRLDIQHPDYLTDALTAFRSRNRASGFMQAAVAGLSDAEIAEAARFFGKGPRVALKMPDPPAEITACVVCHGPPAPARTRIPVLAGQHPGYLARQLDLFLSEDKPRGGGPFFPLMDKASHQIDPDAIPSLADWYGSVGR